MNDELLRFYWSVGEDIVKKNAEAKWGDGGIAMFVKEINKVIPENMQPLAASKVTQWLVSVGYLVEQQSGDGRKYKAPTELGTSIGMTSAWRDGSQGQYLAISYDANAQHFILENLFKLYFDFASL